MALSSKQLVAQRRHRQRGRAVNTLCRAIAQMDDLPDVFTPQEVRVIHDRFRSLMQCWQAAHPEVMP